jgi:hypothetical protein
VSRGQSVILAMHAADALLGGSDIGLLIRLREPLDADAMFDAYAALVAEHPPLRSELVLDAGRFEWRPTSEEQWRARLEHERERWAGGGSFELHASEHRPLASTLPFAMRRTDEGALYLSIQHAWADGTAALRWAAALLDRYAGGSEASQTRALARAPSNPVERARLRFVIELLRRAIPARLRAKQIADLSHGRAPTLPNREGFCVFEELLDRAALEQLQRRALARRATLTQLLCAEIGEVLFAATQASRTRLSIPVSLPEQPPGLYHGNYVASLPVELTRVGDPLAQTLAEFRIQDSFPLGFAQVLDDRVASARDQLALSRELSSHFALAQADRRRGLLRQFSAIVSNLGRVSELPLRRHAASVSVHGKFEYLAFGFAQLGGSASVTVSAPLSTFERERVAAVFGDLCARLRTPSEQS